jgi:hypothetical protein
MKPMKNMKVSAFSVFSAFPNSLKTSVVANSRFSGNDDARRRGLAGRRSEAC